MPGGPGERSLLVDARALQAPGIGRYLREILAHILAAAPFSRITLLGSTRQLTAFVEAEEADVNRLFVPFGDLTNGTETYAAGRYIDLERTVSGLYEVDFNRAYHPYCFYNPKYDCPYPPPENRLQVPIRAGERARE